MKENKKKHSHLAIYAAVTTVVVVFLLVTWSLTNYKETMVSEEIDYVPIISLECRSDEVENAFFSSEIVQRYTHLVTLTFRNKSFDKISYRYDGTYRAEDIAETEMARMHAKYNKYTGESGVYFGSLNPVFSAVKTKVEISLYGERKTMNRAVMDLFFLEKDVYDELETLDEQDFKKKYEAKGFACILRE